MTNEQAIAELQKEHDLIANEHDLDGSRLAPALLEALAMAIEALNHSEIPNSSDCIDRAEAQTAIQFAARRYTVAHEAHGAGKVVWSDNLIGVTDAMNALREVPPAQPERKRGKWILKKELVPLAWDCTPMDYDNYDEETHCELKWFYHCSNCDWKSGEFKGGNFCTNCGADMR